MSASAQQKSKVITVEKESACTPGGNQAKPEASEQEAVAPPATTIMQEGLADAEASRGEIYRSIEHNNFADCEPTAPAADEVPQSDQDDRPHDAPAIASINGGTDALVITYEACKAGQVESGAPFVQISSNWSPEAHRVLAGSLEFFIVYKEVSAEAQESIRIQIKKDSGRKREMNKDNPHLVSVNANIHPGSIAQQKDASRFAEVVMVTAHEGTRPDGAGLFLQQHNQAWCLGQARKLKKDENPESEKRNTPKVLRPYEMIFAALPSNSGKIFDIVSAKLASIEAEWKSLKPRRRLGHLSPR